MEVIKGPVENKTPKVMIYGCSGVGKTTLAAHMKNPIIIDLEGGSDLIGDDPKLANVARTPLVTNVETFQQILIDLLVDGKKKERKYDTIVIDSIDWLVRYYVEKTAGIGKGTMANTLNKSNGGYGNGKQVLENYIRTSLLQTLRILNNQGYAICLVAHANQKTLLNPDGTNEVRISPKIDINTMEIFVEWCDEVFLLKKDTDGTRTLLVEADNAAVAKNRLGLTGEIVLDDEFDINKLLNVKVTNKKEK